MRRTRFSSGSTAVEVIADGVHLAGDLHVPDSARGLVVFSHGCGSNRLSLRNRYVAGVLNRGLIGTLLVDLLTEQEARVARQAPSLRFNIALMTRRLAAVTDWVAAQDKLRNLGLGYFGASTGAAAAIAAASERPRLVQAVVCRGGRPDLAGPGTRWLRAPSLFIVGAGDPVVLHLNRAAMAELPQFTERRLEVIPGATHLFEEPGALDRVAELAKHWFRWHLTARPVPLQTDAAGRSMTAAM